MAIGALPPGVHTREREAFRVHESAELRKRLLLAVARVARLDEPPLVRILVARLAALREPQEARAAAGEHVDVRIHVTGLAIESRMGAVETELNEIVPERGRIRDASEREHARIDGLERVAVMLDVALPAARGLPGRHVAVEAGLRRKLRGDRRVTLAAGSGHLGRTLTVAALAAPALDELRHSRVHRGQRTRRRRLGLVEHDREHDQQRQHRECRTRLEELHGQSSPNEA